MARWRAVVATTATLALLAGAYVTLDAHDVLPGPLTLASPWPQPSAFPTAPAAAAAGTATAALSDLDAAAAGPSDAAVAAKVAALVADARLGPSVGVLVADQLTGADVAASGADTAHQPASTAKLVTAVAALTALDPSSTLTTRAVLSGSTLVLVGGGDVMLGADAGDPTAVDGRAGLGDLAAQAATALTAAGVRSVTLGVDDSLFSAQRTAPGWAASYVSDGFVAPVTPLAVHIAKKDPSQEYSPRAADPSLAAAAVFAARLAEHGVTVTGQVRRTTAPAEARQVGAVSSASIRDVVGYFLENSDNTVTEVVARLVALSQQLPTTFDGATQAVLHVVSGLGVDVTGAHLADASGLASGSSVTPRLLAGVVRAATSTDHPRLRDVIAGLPIGGLTGTLDDRFTTSAARGLVRAKTGSLAGVTSLAGTLVDADGRALVFVVMADQTPGPGQDAARRAVDGFVSQLADCGCR